MAQYANDEQARQRSSAGRPSYAHLIRRQLEHKLATCDTPQPYAVSLKNAMALCGEDINGRLKGAILLDLGGGCRQELLEPVEEFARQQGVSKVIHVDYRPGNRPDHTSRGLVVAHVHSDMLAFLAKQPSRSMSVTINGIDSCVIEQEAYAAAVGEEVSRVVPAGGLAFGYHAWPLRFLKGFSPIKEIGSGQDMPSGYYLKTTATGKTGSFRRAPQSA
jgi:hypothetical protein